MPISNLGNPMPADTSGVKKTLLKFVSDNKGLIMGVIIIISVFIYAKVKINTAENRYIAEKEKLILAGNNTIDSLNEAHIKQVTVVLSWAVRRHLLHDNLEEIDLLFMSFVKENSVAKIQLINPNNATVIISTDKNEEGQNVDNPDILKTSTVQILKPKNALTQIVVAPIMGLNQKEGVLLVHYYLKKM